MLLSAQQFAATLPELRPQLHAFLARKGPYSPEDSEDLVEDAICIALEHLADYHPETGDRGLWLWLRGILQVVLMRFHDQVGHNVETVPIETAAELPAPPPSIAPRYVAAQSIRQLPRLQRHLVWAWLDGYTVMQMARAYSLHRHTISKYLNLAFHSLRTIVPLGEYHTFTDSDFDYCRRVTVYHPPIGVWPSWRHTHPPDKVLWGNAYRRPALPVRLVPRGRRVPPLPKAA